MKHFTIIRSCSSSHLPPLQGRKGRTHTPFFVCFTNAQLLTFSYKYLMKSVGQETFVPRLFNGPRLLVEIYELNQLFLQYLLSAHRLPDELVLQKLYDVWSQLKVFNQTSAERE